MTDRTPDASASEADQLEDWRRQYEQSENGLWVWWAINLCTNCDMPLPIWVLEYLRKASDGLMAISECCNPLTMPSRADFESAETYSAARVAWIREGRKVACDKDARAAFWAGAASLAIEALHLHAPDKNHFRTIGAALQKYLAASGKYVLDERKWLASQRNRNVQDKTLEGHAREGQKMFPSLIGKRTKPRKS